MVRKILFFADGESPDEKALAHAASVAAYLNASLTVVSVVKPSPRWVLTRGADLTITPAGPNWTSLRPLMPTLMT
jgi:nucleotide-binding universal stress UspA family protein